MNEATPRWPAWKFGHEREDLYTTLHDQYNTFPSAIQDREAFYHDVLDVATHAANADQFHTGLQERRAARLQELNEALDSTACELIGRPSLLPGDTDHWATALRLFRSKSLDALVQYFSMFIPPDERGVLSYGPQPPPTPSQSPVLPFLKPVQQFELSAMLDEDATRLHSPPAKIAPSHLLPSTPPTSPPTTSQIDPLSQRLRRRAAAATKRDTASKQRSGPRRSQRITQQKGVSEHKIRKSEPRRKMTRNRRAKG